MATAQLMQFLLALPDYAFNMAGDVGTEDRLLYSTAPPGTPFHMLGAYPRVVYRFGWRGQADRITVSFMVPTGAGMEVINIAVQVAAWGMFTPNVWKSMILRYLPLGIFDFPVQEY